MINDAVVSYVVVGRCVLVAGDGDEDVGGVGSAVGGNLTMMETFLACTMVDLIRAVGGVCGDVAGGNRTLMETFLTCKMVDLI